MRSGEQSLGFILEFPSVFVSVLSDDARELMRTITPESTITKNRTNRTETHNTNPHLILLCWADP